MASLHIDVRFNIITLRVQNDRVATIECQTSRKFGFDNIAAALSMRIIRRVSRSILCLLIGIAVINVLNLGYRLWPSLCR